MKIKITVVVAAALLFSAGICAQTPAAVHRQIAAKRVPSPIKMDGLIDDAAWKDAPQATGFIELRPTPFRGEEAANRTEVYMLYDDGGIYVGGYCHEKSKDSISTELNGRDGFGNNDWLGVVFDTYDDKINGFEYFTTPLGEQMDAKISNTGNEDFSWNAVWISKAAIHADGWSFEMFIPLSAIRFSKKPIQNWGFNIMRRRQKTGQQVFWNTLDPNVNGFLTQNGMWNGLENIKPPLRLQFSPYFSTYANHFPANQPGQKNWSTSVSGGMDVKYGINQAFTLDMTLIPDFGQVQSDNRVLNLSPFEIRYTENRPFFTEGTELFTKGNLFYARRIGIDPLLLHSTSEYTDLTGEKVVKNPAESKLINATKISGRTQKGLGIGVLNAVTNTRYATLENPVTKDQRKVVIDPLTNYNVIVLDQSLKNNSSVSLVNTNVWRSGNDYDANVTAALFSVNDKTNTWNLNGKIANSNRIGALPGNKNESGYNHNFSFGKTSGRFNFNFGQELTNSKFNSRDMGYFQFSNFLDHYGWVGYRWIKPSKWYNNIYLNFNLFYSRQLKPSIYRSANFNANVNGQLKNQWYVGALVGYEPKFNDFFEPRVDGRMFRGWSNYFLDAWFETNNAKKYRIYSELLYVSRSLFDSKRFQFNFNQRYRFSDKLSVSHSMYSEPQKNNAGFVDLVGYNDTNPANDTIVFGRRDRKTIENTVSIKYSFNTKMNINVRFRHYWSEVDYRQFYTLLPNGDLEPNNSYNGNANQNYNVFNMDAVYTWQFAGGSFINIVWKNFAQDFNQVVHDRYFKNFGNTMKADDINNLSFKIIYFLDYLQLKNKKKKSS